MQRFTASIISSSCRRNRCSRSREPPRYPGAVSHLDLGRLRIRSGEQFRDTRAVRLEPFTLGGQRYEPVPEEPDADLVVTRTSSGLLFELMLAARLQGPCFRCLEDAGLEIPLRAREYHATSPAGSEDLVSQYVADDRLDLSGWARDTLALALPAKILCREDCAGLCPVCGKDLNAEPHEHAEDESDSRWAPLAKLRDRL
jgi:DUF177 domain-containing protein